jgi:hypothetical protein
MPRRLPTLLAALLAAIALAPALAHADGDPASDVLLGESVFYPYSPQVSPSIQKALNAETAAAARDHFPIKVALIGSPVDLGVIPDLFGKPQKYADFLDQEISFQKKQPLLVVMSTGYGVQGLPPAAQQAAASLKKPTGTKPNDLAQAAITAVAKLADATGHSVKGGSTQATGSNGNSKTILVLALALAAVLTAMAIIVVRQRQTTAR